MASPGSPGPLKRGMPTDTSQSSDERWTRLEPRNIRFSSLLTSSRSSSSGTQAFWPDPLSKSCGFGETRESQLGLRRPSPAHPRPSNRYPRLASADKSPVRRSPRVEEKLQAKKLNDGHQPAA